MTTSTRLAAVDIAEHALTFIRAHSLHAPAFDVTSLFGFSTWMWFQPEPFLAWCAALGATEVGVERKDGDIYLRLNETHDGVEYRVSASLTKPRGWRLSVPRDGELMTVAAVRKLLDELGDDAYPRDLHGNPIR